MTQQTITIKKTDFEKLINRLEKLEKQVKKLTANIPHKKSFIEGSPEWWEEETKEGIKDLKKGRSTTIHDAKELKEFFDNL